MNKLAMRRGLRFPFGLAVLAVLFAALLGSPQPARAGDTNQVGGGGGSPFRATCNDGDVLIGLEYDAGKDLNYIIPICGAVSNGLLSGPTYKLRMSGTPRDIGGADPFACGDCAVMCPRGTSVTGMYATVSRVNLVHSFYLYCSDLAPGGVVNQRTGASHTLGGEGPDGAVAACAPQMFATGVIGGYGALVDRLGLVCAGKPVQAAAAQPAPPRDTSPPRTKPQTVMLESTNFPGMFVRHRDWQGLLTKLSSDLDFKDATFNMGPGLTGQGRSSVSFESAEYPGYYLRHKNFVVVLEKNDGSQQFAQDATFSRIKPGSSKGTELESVNIDGFFIRHKDFKLLLEKGDGSAQFRADSLFVVEPPVAPSQPHDVDNGDGDDNGGGQGGGASAATDTTIYAKPAGQEVDYLPAGAPVTIVACNGDNWCQISMPRKGWVWGDDLKR